MANQRSGITLIETLVVIGIIGILLFISLPAVQYVRETARRTTCENNLRQLTLAILNHESAHSALPDLYNGTFLEHPRYAPDEFHYHSWRTAILPSLEQSTLYDRIDFTSAATAAANQSIANTRLPVYVCPSTSNPTAIVPDIQPFKDGTTPSHTIGTAARSDYEVIGGVSFRPSGTKDLENVKFGAWGEPRSYPSSASSITYRKARLRDISDGQSNTMLIAERGGRPDLYEKGRAVDPYPYHNSKSGMDHYQAAWAISTHFWWTVFWHEQGVNETNRTGVFGFHPSGANAGLADGSVRFLHESVDQAVLNALATRSAGDIVTLE